jgi:single-strand DNA-binding protein
MAQGLNKAILIGNLGTDPEVRFTQGNQAVANFRLATNESWTDKGGTKQDRTEWHNIVVWGRTAETAGKYLSKGSQVYIEGRIQTRQWEKDGRKMYTTEIVANQILFLGGRGELRQASEPVRANNAVVRQFDGPGDDSFPF